MREDGLNVVPSKNTEDACPALAEGLRKQFHQPSVLQKKGACSVSSKASDKFLRKIL